MSPIYQILMQHPWSWNREQIDQLTMWQIELVLEMARADLRLP